MLITRSDIEAYRAAVKSLGERADEYVRKAIAARKWKGVTDMREAAIAAIADTVGIHGDLSQALAGQLFEEVCAANGMSATAGIYDDIIDPDMAEDKVRYFAKFLSEGDRETFVNHCARLADFYVWRCNREAQVRNCSAYDVRYARVPTGMETCDWCIMLASRGFVYHSEADADAGSHVGCDCVTCPGFGGDKTRDPTQIEGYDPNELYVLWYERTGGTAPGRGGGGTYMSDFKKSMLERRLSDDEGKRLVSRWLKGLGSKGNTKQDVMEISARAWTNLESEGRIVLSPEVYNRTVERLLRAESKYGISKKEMDEFMNWWLKHH